MLDALGWALLHSLWQGALIAGLLAAGRLAARSPRIRYASAVLALLALFVAFLGTIVSLIPEAPPVRPQLNAAGLAVRGLVSGFPVAEAELAGLVPWLAALWIAGVTIAGARNLAGWLSVARLRRRGVCLPPGQWLTQLTRLARRAGITRSIQLLESSLAESPLTLGHLRPLILIPAGLLAALPPEQIEAILLHELAHIRRHDYLVNLLQRFVETVLFYHPAAWWISQVIRSEREHCCDDTVVKLSGDRATYAAALAALEQSRSISSEAALAASGGNLVNRIRRLLYPEAPSPRTWSPWLGLAALTLASAAALTAWQQETPRNPYTSWLNQDVVYIIEDRERAVFLTLATDAEKTQFIQQFWLRRDPTPGTTPNEFKEEHYRRIAYSNERFGTAAGTPGWQTDRGRIYIVNGPPDEIESHPSGGARIAFPYEVWLYHHIDGVGDNATVTFIDRGRRGDFRLTPASGSVR